MGEISRLCSSDIKRKSLHVNISPVKLSYKVIIASNIWSYPGVTQITS